MRATGASQKASHRVIQPTRFKVRAIFKSVFTREYEVLRSHLRQARKKVGLSQTELARRLDQTQLFVSRSELGDRKVDVIELRAICKVMGLPFVQFISDLDAELERLEGDSPKTAPGTQ